MTNVVSLAAVRAQREIAAAPLSDTQLSDRIDAVAHQYLSPGAVLLLRQVFRFRQEGRSELSYLFLCSELQVTKQTLSKYIEELELHCFVKVRRSTVSKVNATNQFEIDFKGPLGASMPALKTPRHERKGGSAKIILPSRGVVQKVDSNNISTEDKTMIPKGIKRAVAPRFDSISDAIEHTSTRVSRKREEKVAKVIKSGSQLTLAGVKATWASAMLKHYPKVPPVLFTSKEFAIFKMRVLPILTTSNLSEFFDFIVSSWSSLREIKFKWLRVKGKDVAVSPSLPELMRYWKVFAQAFSDSKMAEIVNKDKVKLDKTQVLEDQLAAQQSEIAKTKAEMARLRDRLARAERLASAPVPTQEKPKQSLSERRRLAEKQYNDGSNEIPNWK